MARYIRQRDNYSCGPVAIMNALKWAGAPKGTAYTRLGFWRSACGTDRNGTPFTNMLRLARRLPVLSVDPRRQVSLGEINAHLRSGGAVILGSVSEPMGGFHWFLVIGRVAQANEVSYRVVNFDRRATQRLVSAATIKRGMRQAASRDGYPRALLLRRR